MKLVITQFVTFSCWVTWVSEKKQHHNYKMIARCVPVCIFCYVVTVCLSIYILLFWSAFVVK